jgi:multidrug resistance efflux pump
MEEARRIQPAIEPLTEISIDHGHFFSDVMFDNIFTDMAQHERIEGSNAQVNNALAHLKSQLHAQSSRQNAAEAALRDAAANLEGARKELQRIRAQAFETFGVNGAAPPAYGS